MPCCVLRFLVFRPAPSPVLFDIAAHRPGFASALACPADYWRVLCCVFGFLGQVWALFHLISQHTDAYACRRSPVGTSSSPPHLLPVSHSLSARRPRRSVCCVFWFLGPPRALFHPISQHTGRVSRLPLGHPAGTVLRFRGIRSEIGLKKQDIAAHRPRRDAAWMEAQVLGADAGARVRGVWRRPGCRAWVCGGVWKRGEAAHRVWERGCGNAVWGEG